MSRLQETLNTLNPFVTGIRQMDGVTLVDIQLNNGWKLTDSTFIKMVDGDKPNHYILYSENRMSGLDDMLSYLAGVIKANREREEKITLLKEKINELKTYFVNYTLVELQTLKFVLGKEGVKNEVLDLDELEIPLIQTPVVPQQQLVENRLETPQIQPELSQEDLEYLEEEKRAKNYLKLKQAGKLNVETLNTIGVIEEANDYIKTCKCAEGEACGLCIDNQ